MRNVPSIARKQLMRIPRTTIRRSLLVVALIAADLAYIRGPINFNLLVSLPVLQICLRCRTRLVRARKPGESIVFGSVPFPKNTGAVPPLPVPGTAEPTASGGGAPPPCQAVAALPSLVGGSRGAETGPPADWLTD